MKFRLVCAAARYALSRDCAIVRPTADQFMALRGRVARRFPKRGVNAAEGKLARERKISNAWAAEMRLRGWLHEEGYAPGSWAAK
jgi:hypothetical protein